MSKTDLERLEESYSAYEKGLEKIKNEARNGEVGLKMLDLFNQSVQITMIYYIALQLTKLNETITRELRHDV
jgi:hypothetical protein